MKCEKSFLEKMWIKLVNFFVHLLLSFFGQSRWLVWQRDLVINMFRTRCSIAILLGCTKRARKEMRAGSMIALLFDAFDTGRTWADVMFCTKGRAKRKGKQSLRWGETRKGMWCNKCCLQHHASTSYQKRIILGIKHIKVGAGGTSDTKHYRVASLAHASSNWQEKATHASSSGHCTLKISKPCCPLRDTIEATMVPLILYASP